jgi:hypothetical protein
MSKKKTASKPLPPNYIAFDEDRDEIIAVGPKEHVLDNIKSYCESEGWDEDDIQTSVKVYELGKRIDLDVERQLEIRF